MIERENALTYTNKFPARVMKLRDYDFVDYSYMMSIVRM